MEEAGLEGSLSEGTWSATAGSRQAQLLASVEHMPQRGKK